MIRDVLMIVLLLFMLAVGLHLAGCAPARADTGAECPSAPGCVRVINDVTSMPVYRTVEAPRRETYSRRGNIAELSTGDVPRVWYMRVDEHDAVCFLAWGANKVAMQCFPHAALKTSR